MKEFSVMANCKHTKQDVFIEVKKSNPNYYIVGEKYVLIDFGSKEVEKYITLVGKRTILFQDADESLAYQDKQLDLKNYRRYMSNYLLPTDMIDILTFSTNYNPLHYTR